MKSSPITPFVTWTQDEVPKVGANSEVRDLYQSHELDLSDKLKASKSSQLQAPSVARTNHAPISIPSQLLKIRPNHKLLQNRVLDKDLRRLNVYKGCIIGLLQGENSVQCEYL